METLTVEINQDFVQAHDEFFVGEHSSIMITPPLDEDYWLFRVKLSDEQAIIGFPKFGTIGISFAVEEDWNTNLPSTCEAEMIFGHIKHNKGDEQITDEACMQAIGLVQKAAKQWTERQ